MRMKNDSRISCVRLLGPSRRAYFRIRLANNIEKSIPLKTSDPKIIRERAAEVRVAIPLIKARIPVEFGWLVGDGLTKVGGSIDHYFEKFISARNVEGLAPKTLAG